MLNFKYLLGLIACLGLCGGAEAQSPANPKPRYEEDIRKFEAADAKAAPPKNAIVFVGSSSIRMWTNLNDQFPDRKIIRRGFGGSRMDEVRAYADRIVIPYRPALVLVYAGDNDIADGRQPREVFEEFKLFVAKVQRAVPGVEIGYISIKPSPSRLKYLEAMRKTNQLISRYAHKTPQVFYIDVFTPMLGKDGMPRQELFQKDRLHLNPEGYDLWAEIVRPYL